MGELPLMIAVCSARGHARAAGLLTDISSFRLRADMTGGAGNRIFQGAACPESA
jgi:hypothetical protein